MLLAVDCFVSNTCSVLVLTDTVVLLAHAATFLAWVTTYLELKLSCSLSSILSTVHLHVVTTLVRTTREAFGFCGGF